MNRLLMLGTFIVAGSFAVRAEVETIDLKAVAKKARPAVVLLVVSDATGKEIATGTGFLVAGDGKLITNHHVIEGAASAVAKAENGGKFEVEGVLAEDLKNDLVLLKLKGRNLPFLPLASTAKTEVGTRIAVIGSPLGLEGTLSEGIISAIREDPSKTEKWLQITASISHGSSGSPILNATGEVIGVATALLNGGQTLNFAVPVEFANLLIKQAPTGKPPQPISSFVKEQQDELYTSPEFKAFNIAYKSPDYVEALKLIKPLLARFPNNEIVYLKLGYIYGQLGFQADEVASYQQAIKLKPDYASAWINLGVVYFENGNTEEAATCFQRAIKIEPQNAVAWSNLGGMYHNLGRDDDASAALERALKIDPKDECAWYNIGVCYRDTGRTAEAVAAFERATKLKPDYAGAWHNLGLMYKQTGRMADAQVALDRAKNLRREPVK